MHLALIKTCKYYFAQCHIYICNNCLLKKKKNQNQHLILNLIVDSVPFIDIND